jgi:hypothetical protein
MQWNDDELKELPRWIEKHVRRGTSWKKRVALWKRDFGTSWSMGSLRGQYNRLQLGWVQCLAQPPCPPRTLQVYLSNPQSGAHPYTVSVVNKSLGKPCLVLKLPYSFNLTLPCVFRCTNLFLCGMHERRTQRIMTLIFTSPILNLILHLSYNTHLAVSLARVVIYTLCSSWWPKKNKFGSLQRRGRIKQCRVNISYGNKLCQVLHHA